LTPSQISTAGGSVTLTGWTIANTGGSFSLEGTLQNGFYLSTDPIITTADTRLTNNSNTAEVLEAGESFQWGGPTLSIPALAAGTYYIGILVDYTDVVAESNEANNYVSAPLVVVPPVVAIDGVMSASEWDDATQYGPFTVNLPFGQTTSATFFLKNTSTQLLGVLQFARDITVFEWITVRFRLDENANGVWDNDEDGFSLFPYANGFHLDVFLDAFAACDGQQCSEAGDTAGGGGPDGGTKSTASPTIIEFAKGINNSDSRDALLSPGQILRFNATFDIRQGTLTLPSGWTEYTVK
jgi:hypothetical protein